jgi:hypothetical protein
MINDRPRLVAALALLGAIAVVGCGEGETTVTAPSTVVQEVPETTAPTTDPATTETDAGLETGAVIGSTQTTIADVPVDVEITELTRDDKFATLNFTIANTSSRDSDVFYRQLDDSGSGTAADGLVLIDPASGAEYRVIRNPGEGCLCSDELPFTLTGNQRVNIYATFDAPPPTVAELNVSFPGSVGTITGVPIT